jgi:hypothetical protein
MQLHSCVVRQRPSCMCHCASISPSVPTHEVCLALQIQVQLQELLLQFCSAEVFTPPTKVCEPGAMTAVFQPPPLLRLMLTVMCCTFRAQVPAKWVGSGATIALVPKTCLIYPDQKTLACSPAKLVLTKSAGTAVLHLYQPFTL